MMNSVAPAVSISTHANDHLALSFAPLSIDTAYHLATDPANGAVVLMSGMVRDNTDGKPVIALDYQAYEPMALRVFQQIAAQIRQTWPDVTHTVIHHRNQRAGGYRLSPSSRSLCSLQICNRYFKA